MEGAHPVGASYAPTAASTRGLSTARSVLRVLALLAERPAGIRADEVAERLGKSTSTAYYLLSSLCEEGFAVHESKGVYRPAGGWQALTAAAEAAAPYDESLRSTVEELFVLTRRRSYLGIVRDGSIAIVAVRGRQGVPRMPGLGTEIRDAAHALAMGKVVLAELSPEVLARYVERGLRACTPHTITRPQELIDELARVRGDGYAVDREEFDENFCCVAAPIRDGAGRFVAVLGLSVTATVFGEERGRLAEALLGVAERATPAASGESAARARGGLRGRARRPRLAPVP